MRNKIYIWLREEIYKLVLDRTFFIRDSVHNSIIDKVESKVKGRTFLI
jgi:hypothetical protein